MILAGIVYCSLRLQSERPRRASVGCRAAQIWSLASEAARAGWDAPSKALLTCWLTLSSFCPMVVQRRSRSSLRVGLSDSLWWMGNRPERNARRDGEQTKKA